MEVIFPSLNKIINEKFIPIFHNKDRYLILYGGRGSSKSNFAAKKKIYECLTFPYFRDILIRDTYSSIKDSQYQTIKDIIYDFGIESLFRFKENPLEIHCKNGNKFLARGCDDVDKIKSIKDPTGAWYEEGNNISQEDFLTITTSIRTSKAPYLQEIFSFNPECEGNPENFWIYKMFFKDKESLSFSSDLEIDLLNGEKLKTPYTVHHSTYEDNRWCTDEFKAFLEQLRLFDSYFYDVYCKGLWGQREIKNKFATQYIPDKHESTLAVKKDGLQVLIRVDFNLNPFAVTFSHLWNDKDGEHWHIFDEASIVNGSVPAMIDLIKTRYYSDLPNCKITGDHWGVVKDKGQADLASYYDQMERGLGLRPSQIVVPANPRHKNSRADVNYVLYHFPDYKINPITCPGLCYDMRNVQCDAYGEIIKKNRNDLAQRADFIDTERYGINLELFDWIQRHQKGFYKRKG